MVSAASLPFAHYRPLWIASAIRGRIRRDLEPMVAGLPELELTDHGWRLCERGDSRSERSRLLQSAAQGLRKLGLIADWRNERSALLDESGIELARCERGVFRTLGLRNRAVHINGYRADGRLWIARRSAQKRADPGKLDNVAAGGVSAGESLRRAALRELWEEAGVPRHLASKVDFPGMVIRSVRETQFGIHDQQVIIADIELPLSFTPEGRDGEVEEFLCLSPDEVIGALSQGEFTVEAALATRESLERRGVAVPALSVDAAPTR